MAPVDLRGRYMGILGISWSAGFGIGPWLGGIAADNLGFRLSWPVLGSIGLLAAAAYLLMQQFDRRPVKPGR
jgi:MFS family permease